MLGYCDDVRHNNTFDRTAGSHSLTAAGQRGRWADKMKRHRRALELIDRDLWEARRVLDRVARKIRDANFLVKENLFRVGHALVDIFDIQEQIHRERPDLIPQYLRGTDYETRMLSPKRSERPAKGRRSGGRKQGAAGGRSTAR